MSSLLRRVIDTLIPKGSFWRVPVLSDSDLFYDALAEIWETIRVFLSTLAYIRNPNKTTFLADLENEYGVLTNPTLTESQRRMQLNPIVYDKDSNGSIDDLQNALTSAGFDVQVHSNSPAVDPAIFLTQAFQMVADGDAAFAGNADAFAGSLGGELLVNGEQNTTEKIVDAVAGNMYAGDGQTAGEYTGLIETPITYDVPTDPAAWPFIFFVGGDATRERSNKVINPGFEDDLNSWTIQGATGGSTITSDSIIKHSGSKSAKFTVVTGATTVSLRQEIEVTPGDTVTLSGWINVTNYVSGRVNLDLFSLGLLDTGGISLDAVTTDFEFFQEEIIIPTGVTSVGVRAFCDDSPEMTCYFDDIKLINNNEHPHLISIESGDIPSEQQQAFKRIILKYKPIHSWAALIVGYV